MITYLEWVNFSRHFGFTIRMRFKDWLCDRAWSTPHDVQKKIREQKLVSLRSSLQNIALWRSVTRWIVFPWHSTSLTFFAAFLVPFPQTPRLTWWFQYLGRHIGDFVVHEFASEKIVLKHSYDKESTEQFVFRFSGVSQHRAITVDLRSSGCDYTYRTIEEFTSRRMSEIGGDSDRGDSIERFKYFFVQ